MSVKASLISVNVGLPRDVEWKGRVITTGLFKDPVEGRVMVRRLNLDGDGQADLSVHGGVNKAVYVYPSENYDYWRNELPEEELSWECSEKTFLPRGCLKRMSILAIGSALVLQNFR